MSVNYLLQFGTGDPRTYTGLSPTFLIFKDKDGTNVTPPGITEIPSSTGLYYFAWGTTTNIAFLADAATTSPGSAGRYIAGMLDMSDRISEFGTTLIALGNTAGAVHTNLGTTLVAIGNTSIAYGGSISQSLTNTGSTLVAVGNTSIALGTTNVAIGTSIYALEQTLGSTLVGIGNTSIALGTSIYALEQNIGSTILAIGNTGIALSSSMLALIGTTASLIGDSSTDPADLFGYMKRLAELEQGQERFLKGTGALTMYDRTGATTLASRTITNNSSLVVKT